MNIGIPKERKSHEYRVGLRPVGAALLRKDGHRVVIERDAGLGSGFTDDDYAAAGAEITDDRDRLWAEAELIVKVKEPQEDEIPLLREDLVVFTYFHFAASEELTRTCLEAGISAVAYETLEDRGGGLPLLRPMSEVAGKMSIQEGAKYLEKPMMGRGILLGGVPGVPPANVLVLGGGIVGENATRVAAGVGANVTVMDIDVDRLRELDAIMPANVTTVYSDPHAIADYAAQADLIVGAVLLPGAAAPRLITADMVKDFMPGSVLVDVAVDQGGCFETTSATSHEDPVFVVDDVVHYCVTNMPGAVGRTSAHALCNVTMPYVQQLARKGLDDFCATSPGHRKALNVHRGKIRNAGVAETFPDLPADLDG